MDLIAYRPQYRIYLHVAGNHIVYERLEEMTLATELPHYVADIERALKLVKPGFTVLSDLRRTLGPNPQMLPVFRQVRQMLLAYGVGLMVEVHPPSLSVPKFMQQVRAQSEEIPTHLFTDIAEANAFLQRFWAQQAS
ncbi:hypothetical protein [Hymenobacter yonginensis]|uniref:STAS/SEC14 domain-containing protein n=1 Tax=Hymenobacter yonginensis TaxID=748197 RepID=A0ABY7PL37_9BACT|nr:hypothetical protein [Hymenobacter yonginensis]WBO83317.1 hypothetical protein O9Z63_13105 [Hymenobacter yonginensis]